MSEFDIEKDTAAESTAKSEAVEAFEDFEITAAEEEASEEEASEEAAAEEEASEEEAAEEEAAEEEATEEEAAEEEATEEEAAEEEATEEEAVEEEASEEEAAEEEAAEEEAAEEEASEEEASEEEASEEEASEEEASEEEATEEEIAEEEASEEEASEEEASEEEASEEEAAEEEAAEEEASEDEVEEITDETEELDAAADETEELEAAADETEELEEIEEIEEIAEEATEESDEADSNAVFAAAYFAANGDDAETEEIVEEAAEEESTEEAEEASEEEITEEVDDDDYLDYDDEPRKKIIVSGKTAVITMLVTCFVTIALIAGAFWLGVTMKKDIGVTVVSYTDRFNACDTKSFSVGTMIGVDLVSMTDEDYTFSAEDVKALSSGKTVKKFNDLVNIKAETRFGKIVTMDITFDKKLDEMNNVPGYYLLLVGNALSGALEGIPDSDTAFVLAYTFVAANCYPAPEKGENVYKYSIDGLTIYSDYSKLKDSGLHSDAVIHIENQYPKYIDLDKLDFSWLPIDFSSDSGDKVSASDVTPSDQ